METQNSNQNPQTPNNPNALIQDYYTREDALAEGTLKDVTEMARQAEIPYPVAVTRTVWDDYIARRPQDDWSVLNILLGFTLYCGTDPDPGQTFFEVFVDNVPITLKAVTEMDSSGGTIITILLPNED